MSEEEFDYNLIKDYVEKQFPKLRVKMSPKQRSFKRSIIIPPTLNDGGRVIYSLKDGSNKEIIYIELLKIVRKVFYGFDINIIDDVLNEHLGIN